jgi:hypothetical protein
MGGVFDQLHSQIGGQGEDQGLTLLDLAELSPPLRKLMRLMLREVEMPYSELCEAVQEMPAEDRLSQEELDEALDTLTEQRWLIRLGEETITYEVNLRRKAGSTLAKSIWANLDAKIEEQRRLREEAEQ